MPRQGVLTTELFSAGEDPATGIVAGVTCNPGGSTLVTCVEDERLEFQVSHLCLAMTSSSCSLFASILLQMLTLRGDLLVRRACSVVAASLPGCMPKQFYMQDGMEVTFSEVVGMEELNDGRPRRVKNCKVGSHSPACWRLSLLNSHSPSSHSLEL